MTFIVKKCHVFFMVHCVRTTQLSVGVEVKTARLLIPAVDELRHLLSHQLEAWLNRHHNIIVVHLETFLTTTHINTKARLESLCIISHMESLWSMNHYGYGSTHSSILAAKLYLCQPFLSQLSRKKPWNCYSSKFCLSNVPSNSDNILMAS